MSTPPLASMLWAECAYRTLKGAVLSMLGAIAAAAPYVVGGQT